MAQEISTAEMANNLRAYVHEFGGTDEWMIDAAWYANERANIAAMATDIPINRALSAIACLSGNSGWKGNVTAYRKLATAYASGQLTREMADDPDDTAIRALHIGLVANVRKAIRALFVDGPIETANSARKMRSFECNLAGCEHSGPRCVTVDRWAFCAARGHRHMTEPKVGRNSCSEVPQGSTYASAADAYRIVADECGMTPDGLQAAIWCVIAGYRHIAGVTFGK